MIQCDSVTLFPPMFDAISQHGITARAIENKLYSLSLWNPRNYTIDNHRTVDDRPYGGGPGMVMLAEPLEQAIQAAKARQIVAGVAKPKVIHMSPSGKPLTHEIVMELATYVNSGTAFITRLIMKHAVCDVYTYTQREIKQGKAKGVVSTHAHCD